METFICLVSHDEHPNHEGIPASLIPDKVANLIKIRHPHWQPDEKLVCNVCMNTFRAASMEECLTRKRGKLATVELEVIDSIRSDRMLSEDLNEVDRQRAENEYRVDLKAELEIRDLTDRFDDLMKKQR